MEYYDIREQEVESNVYVIENNKIKTISKNNYSTIGVRYYYNNYFGFASSSDLNKKNNLIKKAKKIAKLKESYSKIKQIKSVNYKKISKVKNIWDDEKIIKFLFSFNELKNKLVKNVKAYLNFKIIKYKYSDVNGNEIIVKNPEIKFGVSLIGEKNKKIQSAFINKAYLGDFKIFKKLNVDQIKKELKKEINDMLKAKKAPAGKFDVILNPGLTGVFFHEAVGHTCEADHFIQNATIFKDKINKRVGNELINLYDDPTIKSWGYYKYDSEGVKGKKVQLIKKGILIGKLHSRETAEELNEELNGHGRAENPRELPIPRMSTIYLKEGKWKFNEMLKEIKNGIFLIDSKGGQVETTTGQFLFNAKRAFLIKNGEIKNPIKDVSLIGNIQETLFNISAISKNKKLDDAGGYCGKDGQNVRVSELAPYILIKNALVGGNDV